MLLDVRLKAVAVCLIGVLGEGDSEKEACGPSSLLPLSLQSRH